jgi:hypothetical protein
VDFFGVRTETAADFAGKPIEFTDGRIVNFGQLRGHGKSAATFETGEDGIVIRVNERMDFMNNFIAGVKLAQLLGIPTQTIVKRVVDNRNTEDFLSGEYVFLKEQLPNQLAPSENPYTFEKATAKYLYENWDSLPKEVREGAHEEFKKFMAKTYAVAAYYDFQPSNFARTKEGWIFIDPTVGEPGAQRLVDSPNSKELPFASAHNHIDWFTEMKLSPNGMKALTELADVVIQARQANPKELMEIVERARAQLP